MTYSREQRFPHSDAKSSVSQTELGGSILSAMAAPVASDAVGPEASFLDDIFYGYKPEVILPSAETHPEIAERYSGISDPAVVDAFVRYNVLSPLDEGSLVSSTGIATRLHHVFSDFELWDFSRIYSAVTQNRQIINPIYEQNWGNGRFDESRLLGFIAIGHYFLRRFPQGTDKHGRFQQWPEVFDEAKTAVVGQPEINGILNWNVREHAVKRNFDFQVGEVRIQPVIDVAVGIQTEFQAEERPAIYSGGLKSDNIFQSETSEDATTPEEGIEVFTGDTSAFFASNRLAKLDHVSERDRLGRTPDERQKVLRASDEPETFQNANQFTRAAAFVERLRKKKHERELRTTADPQNEKIEN